MRILVLGYIVRGPLGGLVWHHLQYVIGLSRLGHDVVFVEDSEDYACCYDPVRNTVSSDATYGLSFTRRVFDRVGLGDRWAYYDAHRGCWHGPRSSDILEICREADLLLNMNAVNPIRSWFEQVPARAMVDTDPVFIQIRNLTEPAIRERALQHTAFFTFGVNFGSPGCGIPDDGFAWRPTRQPVCLDLWPHTDPPDRGGFTTVMQWESYPDHEYGGRAYGTKSHSFRPYLRLPAESTSHFEIAVSGSKAPRELLRREGWIVRDAVEHVRDPWDYQRFIQASRAEFSVAKHGYVVARSGWFSERSAAYLASGRPVLVQETGFSEWLPAGTGIVPFGSPAEAAAGVEAIEGDYARHRSAARALAEEFFDARRVLPRLVEEALEPAAPQAPHRAPISG